MPLLGHPFVSSPCHPERSEGSALVSSAEQILRRSAPQNDIKKPSALSRARLRSVAVALVEALLLVGQVEGAAIEPGGEDAGAQVEDVAVGDDEGRVLAGVERADAGGDAENARGLERHGRAGPVAREAARDG